MRREFPIIEHDESPEAIFDPQRLIKPIDGFPEHCIGCFFQEAIRSIVQTTGAKQIGRLACEMCESPIYLMEFQGRPLALVHPGVGAPLAGGFMDELIAMGCRKFIFVGGAGVLNKQIARGHLIVPTAAIRDEGTSYHYLPPAREVEPDAGAVAAIRAVLDEHRIPHLSGKTWTTDGFYRETAARAELRKAEGCLTVEMEAAAMFAVGRFRGVQVGQILYGGDVVSAGDFDHRDWRSDQIRQKLPWLAAEACLRL